MKYAKIENSTVVQTQPYAEDGFIEVNNNIVCGMVKGGDSFVLPEKTEEQLSQKAINNALSYLNNTDFYMTVDKYAQLTEEKRTELETLREEAREVIRSYEEE